MKTFTMNIHQGLYFTVDLETILETYNLSHENRNREKMYAYYALSKKVDEDANYPFHFYGIKHRVMELKTDEGVIVIHRFASQELNTLERFLTRDLKDWFVDHQFEFKRIERNKVEVNYLKDANCLDCAIYEFSHFTEHFN